jgi:hypothetical protein
MLVRELLEHEHDDAGADLWGREGCRRGARYDCDRLVDRDLELDITAGQIEQIAARQPWPHRREAALIAPDALASHLVAGTRTVEPDPEVRAAFAPTSDSIAGVHLLVCVDTAGKVAEAQAWPATPGRERYASYVRAVEAAATQWRFQPFEVHGKPVPVCAFDVFAYPADHKRDLALASTAESASFDAASTQNVSPQALEAFRIAGNKNIVPDNFTKTRISVSGKSELVGSFKLCLDEGGKVASVKLLKTTGFPAYDQTINRDIHTWRYRPFWVDGRPQPVCTAVTFIYSQH